MHYDYRPRGVCARMIHMELDDDRQTITSMSFEGGCPGNLKAISKLVDGMSVDEIESKLLGNTCGPKPTSCADQLAKAVRQAYDQEHAGAAQ